MDNPVEKVPATGELPAKEELIALLSDLNSAVNEVIRSATDLREREIANVKNLARYAEVHSKIFYLIKSLP